MSEPTMQRDSNIPTNAIQDGNTSTTIPGILPGNGISTSGDYWDTLRLFPLRLDEYGFNHWALPDRVDTIPYL